MKVSIIIPVYNVEKYLRECLESVVNQTLKDVEIICINDGSTDKSLDILRNYEEKYSNLKVINQENKGLGLTRNVGIELAKGEYIYFLDSDDYITLDAMEICYNESKNNNLDILTFEAECFWDDLPKGGYSKEEYNRDDLQYLGVIEGKEFYIKSKKIRKYAIAVWFNFYNKEFIKQNKLFFEDILYEDILYTPKCLYKAKRVKYINKILNKRRVRQNSITTSSLKIENNISYINLTKYLINESENFDEDNSEFMHFFRNEIYYSLERAVYMSSLFNGIEKEFLNISNYKYIDNDIRYNLCLDSQKLYYSTYNFTIKDIQLNKDYELKVSNKLKIHYILVPDFGDIEQQTVIYSTLNFLKYNYPNHEIIMYGYKEILYFIQVINDTYKKGDFVVVNGGKIGHGYGDEGKKYEKYILDNLKNIPVILFPKIINDELEYLNNFCNNENITLLVNEKNNYESLKKYYKDNKIFLCPNIIFYLNDKLSLDHKFVRNQIMTCFINDYESKFTEYEKEELIKKISLNYSVFKYNLEINYSTFEKNLEREVKLKHLLNEYYKTKVVITDKIYSMIFAFITKTPCVFIVQDINEFYNDYEWIKNINYIKCINYTNSDNILKLIYELENIKINDYNNLRNYICFDNIKCMIDNLLC